MINALPEQIEQVQCRLVDLGAEIHVVAKNGQIVVTLEDEYDNNISAALIDFQNIPGVVSAAMVYHEIDPIGIDA